MAKHHGKNGLVKIGANAVAEVTRWTIQETADTSDTTAMRQSWQTHLTNIPAWSGTVEGWYDPADTNGQVALVIGGSVTIGLYSDGDAAGKQYFSGTASITQRSVEGAVNGTVSFSINITGNGALATETVGA